MRSVRIWFASTAIAVGTLYMPLIDRVGGRRLLVWATVLQVLGFVPFVLFHVTFLTALVNVLLFGVGVGAGIGQQSLFQLWSGELFPTLLRSTAQGSMFGVVRIALGGWSLLLPTVQRLVVDSGADAESATVSSVGKRGDRDVAGVRRRLR